MKAAWPFWKQWELEGVGEVWGGSFFSHCSALFQSLHVYLHDTAVLSILTSLDMLSLLLCKPLESDYYYYYW